MEIEEIKLNAYCIYVGKGDGNGDKFKLIEYKNEEVVAHNNDLSWFGSSLEFLLNFRTLDGDTDFGA